MKWLLVLLSLLSVATYPQPQSWQESPLQFRQALGSPASLYSQELLSEAYRRLGVRVEFIEVPFGRSLVESNKGELAGELARVLRVTESYPALLPVPYVLFDTDVFLYVNQQRCAGCQLQQVQSLAYVRGAMVVEDILRTLPASRQVISTGSLEATKNLFLTGKVDSVVFAAYQLDASTGFPIAEQRLQSLPDYHLLHQSHQALIPELTAMLYQLEREGFAERLRLRFGVAAPKRQLSRHEKPFAEY